MDDSPIHNKTPEECTKALYKVADYLARRDHSALELKTKLSRRFPPEVITWALEQAQERGWMAPPQELSQRVAEALHHKKKGHRAILQYLMKKGLPPVSKDEDRERLKMRELLSSKFHKTCKLSFEEKAKAYRFLQTRGFEEPLIKEVIHETE